MDSSKMTRKWQEAYKRKRIAPELYEDILLEIGEEELLKAIESRKNGSAGGRSGITYEWLKRLGPESLNQFRRLLNRILKEAQMPQQWKLSNILPIPKKMDWNNDLNLLRPIALLEAPRKILTKIISDRMGATLVKNKILQSNNWAGLPKGNTEQPIIIANNILEEA